MRHYLVGRIKDRVSDMAKEFAAQVRRCRFTPGAPQVDPRFSQLAPRLLAALETKI